MSERVWMVHPDLPGQRIHVRPAGVAVRESSGWRVESQEDAEAASQAELAAARDLLVQAGWTVTAPAEAAGGEEAETATAEPRRRRRAETEGE